MAGVVAAGGLAAFALSRYRRCAPNQVLVIFGRTGRTAAPAGGRPAGKANWEGRVQHGGGAFVWPIIQDYSYLSLEPLAIDIDLQGALSHEKIRVNIPTVVTVAIGETVEIQRAAAMRLLGMDRPAVVNQVEEIVIGQLRQVVLHPQCHE